MVGKHMDVREPDGGNQGCRATAEILARIGDKWSALVIAALSSGDAVRYNELNRRIESISQRMLTLTLKALEQDGLIHREQFQTIPPRVEYRLTSLGKTLLPPLRGLLDWAHEHGAAMLAARQTPRGEHSSI